MRNSIIEEDLKNITSYGLDWNMFLGKTVLISGANGFLPAYMVETLLYLNETKNKNIKVLGIVRNKEKAFNRFKKYKNRPDLNLIVQDISKPIKISDKIDYIIHAASQASPKYYGKDPVGTLMPNVIGTYNLLEFARIQKVKSFLFFSSGEVYGEIDEDKIPTKEDSYGPLSPLGMASCYAESKRMGENMCVSWYHQYGVSAKIIRPFHVYGPGMSLDDGRVFADFVSDIVNNRNIVMKSDGRAIRAFCYLSDAVLGFFFVLLKGQNGEAYNIGNDKCEISVSGLADLLVNLFPDKGLKVIKKEEIKGQEYVRSKILRTCPDITKINKLGWKPECSIENGFIRTIRSFL